MSERVVMMSDGDVVLGCPVEKAAGIVVKLRAVPCGPDEGRRSVLGCWAPRWRVVPECQGGGRTSRQGWLGSDRRSQG